MYPSSAPAAKEVDKRVGDTAACAHETREVEAARGRIASPLETGAHHRELEAARGKIANLQREVAEFKGFLCNSTEETKRLKTDKQALKSDLKTTERDVSTWKERYNEVADALRDTKIHHAMQAKEGSDGLKELQKRLDKAGKALADHQERLAVATKALKEHQERLQAMEEERPEIKEKLRIGGAAFRKVQAMEAIVADTKRENEALRARASELLENTAASSEKLRAVEANNSKVRPGDDELRAIKDRLRASALEVAALNHRMQGCALMLTKTEQVLNACSDLYVDKDGSHPLAVALKETSCNVAAFRESLKVG